jgi:phospholipase C
MGSIKNVFVLMLENRSFDHMLAVSGLPGISPPPPTSGFKAGAPDKLKHDPPHEFEFVKTQINGGKMDGFSGDALLGLLPQQIPRLMELAQNYLVMDNWFSSMPGPTWPNRLFAHGASSCGLDNSLKFNETIDSVYFDDRYLSLPRGHIFERCSAKGVSWRVYKTDRFVQTLAMRGMVDAAMAPGNKNKFFRDSTRLASDLASGDAAQYTFIEPYYDLPFFGGGNSQHPVGSIAAGDEFIYQVYSAIRKSPLWAKSLLVVTWDEHGGFFDHVPPPTAPPPGESKAERKLNHDREANPGDCKFDQLGVRVPALIVSPLAPRGLGSLMFPGEVFDHSSIVAFVREVFDLGPPLTARDAWAPTWSSKLLSTPRQDIDPLAKVARITAQAPATLPTAVATSGAQIDGSLAGFAAIAADMDRYIAKHSGTKPLIASTFALKLPAAVSKLSFRTSETPRKKAARRAVVSYLAAVHARVGEYQATQEAVPMKKLGLAEKTASKAGARASSKKRSTDKPASKTRRP